MNQRLIRPLVYTGITAFIAFGMSGCFLGDQQQRDVGYGVTEPVRTLVIKGHTGNVKVTGGGSAVTVTEHQTYRDKEPVTSHVTTDGTLTLSYDCSDCGVGYDVDVPAGTVVKVVVETGGVQLTGLTADVQASTQTGTVTAAALGSATVRLSTETGGIDAAFTTAPTTVSVSAQTGSVRVAVPTDTSYAVAAKAETGGVRVGVPQQNGAAHTIDATTETGSVTVTRA